MASYRRATRERNGIFALSILTLGVLTVFALSRFGLAFTEAPRTGVAPPVAHVQPTATATPKGVVPARLHEYPIPGKEADLMQPAVGPDGSVWYGMMGTNQLGRLDPATGEVKAWTPPDGKYGIMAVAVEASGIVWFTEQSANYIGRFDLSSQAFKTFPLPVTDGRPAAPQDIAIGADGGIWFTEVTAGAIARLDSASGAVRTWPVPRVASNSPVYPYAIALARDGTVWFSGLAGGTIGRLDPRSGAIQLYHAPTADAEIFSLALAPDGKVWFTELQYHKLGVLDPATGVIRELNVPKPVSTTPNLYDVLVDTDGVVWIADMGQNAITRYAPQSNAFTTFALPDASSVPYGLAWGSSGHLWFTADRSPTNYVGVLNS